MIMLRWCQQSFGCGKSLKFCVQSSQRKFVNFLYSCCTVHTTSSAYSKYNYENEKISTQKRLKPAKFLLKTENETIKCVNISNAEQKQAATLVARIIDNLPHRIQPYLKLIRMDKPIGSWLLFWPCGWSIAMAAAPATLPDFRVLALFGIGAFIMRGAGCTINDMWDQDIDGMVARTRDRPLVTGEISPLQSLIFLGSQLTLGCLVLLQLNLYSIILGASSLVLVILYPVMKRVTYWPQLILGMTFNWGALLGWSAIQGFCNWSVCLPLYTAGICWTLLYDTIYAHQDKVDDITVGIKSTALKFGDKTKIYLAGFSVSMIVSLITSGVFVAQTWPYYTAVGIVGTHLANQIYSLNINSPKDCAKKFISNHRVGMIVFAGIILGNLIKDPSQNKDNNDLAKSEENPGFTK